MFRFSIAAVIGVTVALSATADTAHADTIIYQGTPTHDPLIISRGGAAGLPGLSQSVLADPAFHRLAALCGTLGMACEPGQLTHSDGVFTVWTPGHRADAEKRLARIIEEREAQIEALEEQYETLPAPRLPVVPHLDFGWSTLPGAPFVAPRPHPVPDSFSHLLPSRPALPDLSGFHDRLNSPAVVPPGLLPRHAFPWRRF